MGIPWVRIGVLNECFQNVTKEISTKASNETRNWCEKGERNYTLHWIKKVIEQGIGSTVLKSSVKIYHADDDTINIEICRHGES